MSDYTQATIDAIMLFKGARLATDMKVVHRLIDGAIMWLEIDLRNYLTGRS